MKVYKNPAKEVYRTIRIRGKYNTEKAFKWKVWGGFKKAWKESLKCIDEARAKE